MGDMIDSNTIILEFFNNNWIGILLAINFFKVIAVLTPSNKDDSVVALFSDMFDMIKSMGAVAGNIAKLPFKKTGR